MLNTVVIAENPFEPDTWEKFPCEGDIRPLLLEKFEKFPETARIYHNQVSEENDVTPRDEAGVERLGELEGTFHVIVFAGEPISTTTLIYIGIGLLVGGVAALAFTQASTPDIPTISSRNVQSESPNNGLSDRQNKQRVNGRIPDIFGKVRSTPDLLALPYKIFENNIEYEYAYMCVGKGEYEITSTEIKDGETPIESIEGAIVNIYGPNTSPNSGDSPQLELPPSTLIEEPVLSVTRINAVNGQTLKAPNADSVVGSTNIRFGINTNIKSGEGTGKDVNFSDIFENFGETATITNASISVTPTGATTTTLSSYSVKAKFSNFQYTVGTLTFTTASQANLFPADTLITLSNAIFNDGGGNFFLDGIYCVLSSDPITGEVKLRYPREINNNWIEVNSRYVGNETETRLIDIVGRNIAIAVDLTGSFFVNTTFENNVSGLDFVQDVDAPFTTNSDWIYLHACADKQTQLFSPTVTRTDDPWIGPFDIQRTDTEEIWCNFIASNGLYKDSGTAQSTLDVELELEITPIDAGGSPTGSAETFSAFVVGSAVLRSTRAVTLKANPTFTGRCRIRARRVDDTDLAFNGQVVDEIKWKDAYAVAEETQTDFGDVTTVYSKTQATEGALAVKSRKLNMEVTRKIPTRVSGSTFTVGNSATTKIDEIISFICLDPYIGNRSVDEIDFDNIYDTVDAIETYFGTAKAVDFSYTFDKDNLSFEETLISICKAIHSKPFRRGNKVSINFEQETEDSIILFNHRNKIPGTETRTLRFGNVNEYDGVELEYVDPDTDLIDTFYIPTDKSAINPKKIETLGIRDRLQAYFHAYRAWNKIQYQNISGEFEATQETNLVTIGDRILVADNTRPDIQDGEVVSQNGLELTLSQEVDLTVHPSYKIFLQHYDGTVESLDVTAGADSYKVVLGQAPKQALALDPENFATTTYLIVGNTEQSTSAFLVSEKSPQSNFTSIVRVVNYDSRYYQNDLDFDNAIVDDNGNVITP